VANVSRHEYRNYSSNAAIPGPGPFDPVAHSSVSLVGPKASLISVMFVVRMAIMNRFKQNSKLTFHVTYGYLVVSHRARRKSPANEAAGLNSIQITPRFKFGPDLYDTTSNRWWDVMTDTPGYFAKHAKKYNPQFGTGTTSYYNRTNIFVTPSSGPPAP
jgi:hypothetical protein